MNRGLQISETNGAQGSDHWVDHEENCHLSSNIANEYGYLKVRLPENPSNGTKYNNTMIMFDLEMYDYKTNGHGGSGKKFTFGG